jgi:hypothetical protein
MRRYTEISARAHLSSFLEIIEVHPTADTDSACAKIGRELLWLGEMGMLVSIKGPSLLTSIGWGWKENAFRHTKFLTTE